MVNSLISSTIGTNKLTQVFQRPKKFNKPKRHVVCNLYSLDGGRLLWLIRA